MKKINSATVEVIGFDLDHTLYGRSDELDRIIQEHIVEHAAPLLERDIEETKELWQRTYAEVQSGTSTLVQLGLPSKEARKIIQNALDSAPVSEVLTPNEEVIEMLKEVKSIFPNVDLVTGSNLPLTQKKLQAINIPMDMFHHVITGEHSKYTGESFELWMSYYPNVQPGKFVYVGDRPKIDVEIPKEYGMQTILISDKEIEDEVPQVEKVEDILTLFIR